MNSRRTRYRIGHGKVKSSCLLPALQTETECSCLCTTGTKSDGLPDRHLHNVQERISRAGFRPNYRRPIPRIEVPLAVASAEDCLSHELLASQLQVTTDRRTPRVSK